MSEVHKNLPFRTLGVQLKRLRVARQESLAEVSGAVEIDPDALNLIEQGVERPGEEILLLLISHFATKEDVATKLWELAGYDKDDNLMQEGTTVAQPMHQVTNDQGTITYTDMVHVMVNNYGVVINFMQAAPTSSSSHPATVARVGMSKEHARSVLDVLQQTLNLQDNVKRLPTPAKSKDSKKTDQ